MSTELKITTSNFDSETGTGTTLVDFWAPWCAPCHMQGPIIERIADKVNGKAKVGKCNIDEEQTLALKFEIKSIPTLILFQNGKETERFIGLQTENTLIGKINTLLAK
jgi:thioredoxin 1